ncbi:MAG: substrate-binding domain-containing protein [Verrucomicrobia bacterium]|nr:substrate-binding domain-containing protein [Verrucomicrobiota bacterium]
MRKVSKASAADRAAAVLREECLAGRWRDRLPGVRVLAGLLGVSAPTVAAALARLAEQGVLKNEGPRRAFRLAETPPRFLTHEHPRHLLILTPDHLWTLDDATRGVIEHLRDRMIANGWEEDIQVLDYRHAKRVDRRWNHQIRADTNTCIVAVFGRPALAEWARRRKLRILFLGGVMGNVAVPMIGVKTSGMAALALSNLTDLGHRRIVFPLIGNSEPFNVSLREATRTALEAVGQSYVARQHNPESDYLDPGAIAQLMERLLAKRPPTAVVIQDWKILITVFCCLAAHGLRVPADVSLVLLSDRQDGSWFHPELARFRFPVARMATAVAKWLEAESPPADHLIFEPKFIEGRTLAAPRRTL